ncbi:MAG: hypothetical protein IJ093_02050 [Bacilli bacterium]|nr:hypothetical protein [Bacilli bacterium]
MKDKMRVILIYLLMFIVFALTGYLIYFVINNSEQKIVMPVKEEARENEFEVSDACTFDVNTSGLNEVMNGNSTLKLCDGYNKFNVQNVILEGKTLDVYAIYNEKTKDDENTGLFVNNERVIFDLGSGNLVNIGVFSDILYVKKWSDTNVDVLAYNSYGSQIYQLTNSLNNMNLVDQVFVNLNLSEQNVTDKSIDVDSFKFTNEGFTFNSDSKRVCETNQLYKGSTYQVSYINGVFNDPVFVDYVGC